MKTYIELRIAKEDAPLVLRPGEGHDLDTVVVAVIDGADPRLQRVTELQQEFRSKGLFFCRSFIRRSYSKRELSESEWLYLNFKKRQIWDTESAGTGYDTATACPVCEWGAIQATPLYVPLASIRLGLDIMATAGEEFLVSDSFIRTFPQAFLSNVEYGPVVSARRSRSQCSAEITSFRQLILGERFFEIAPPTLIRDSVIDLGEFDTRASVCPLGHTLGHTLVSELYLKTVHSTIAPMISLTKNGFSCKQGIFRPIAPIIVSNEFYRRYEEAGLRGAHFEIAHVRTE